MPSGGWVRARRSNTSVAASPSAGSRAPRWLTHWATCWSTPVAATGCPGMTGSEAMRCNQSPADELVQRRAIEPVDDEQAEIAIPGEQARHAGSRVAGEPGRRERLVQPGLGLGVLRVDLDREVQVLVPGLQGGARSLGVAAHAKLDGAAAQAEEGHRRHHALLADDGERGQLGIVGKLGGLVAPPARGSRRST